jgi:hypothetical protein
MRISHGVNWTLISYQFNCRSFSWNRRFLSIVERLELTEMIERLSMVSKLNKNGSMTFSQEINKYDYMQNDTRWIDTQQNDTQ